jgi:hypothetical protein
MGSGILYLQIGQLIVWGQIVKIKAVNGNSITIEPALRIDYTGTLHPEIRPVSLKTNVGIECLKITRADTIMNNNYGYNISFSYAGNCWGYRYGVGQEPGIAYYAGIW